MSKNAVICAPFLVADLSAWIETKPKISTIVDVPMIRQS